MVSETSSGMSQRLTLDHPSFEKLLAAAWVLQCLHDQLHNQEAVRDENSTALVETPEPVQTGKRSLPAAVQTVAHPFPEVVRVESAREAPSSWPVAEKILAETVVQPPTVIPILKSGVAVKIEPRMAEPGTAELKKSLRSEDVATARVSKPHLPLLEKLVDHYGKQRPRLRPAFNRRTADLRAAILRTANLRITNLRAAFSRTRDAVANLRPAFRVSLTLPALRSVAIVAPVLILATVAALLLLETSRHHALFSAQANSGPVAPAAGAIVSEPSTPSTAARGAFDNHERITNRKPNQHAATPLPRSSHKEVTDPAALVAVQGLSKYEIKTLRRQAKYGDASAAFTLGMAYELGRHVPQNCAEATRWVTTAAEEGNAAAEYNLGLRYRDGDGVPANRAESEKWLRRAAARRYPKANLALKMLASR